VPHGPVSGHGVYTTLGAHPHGAEAIATLMARKSGGLVYPTVFTCFAGATRTFYGTVPFSYEFHVQILKTVCRSLYKQGFGRIVLVAYTNPEDSGGMIAARDLFDEGEMPVAAIVCSKAMEAPEVRALFADYKGRVAEALVDYASLKLLNQERDIAEPALADHIGLEHGPDQPAAILDSMAVMRKHGTRGFRYDNEMEHTPQGTVGLTYKGQPDVELGLRVLSAMADFHLPVVDALKQHRDYLKAHPAKRIEKARGLK
jgi:hypothetical protein